MAHDLQQWMEDIKTRYITEVATPRPLLTAYDNLQFTVPEDASWASLSILPGESTQVSLGSNPMFRTPGVITIMVFVPVESGSKVAVEHADFIVGKFNALSASGITYRTPTASLPGLTGDNKWWQVTVTVPWYVEWFN